MPQQTPARVCLSYFPDEILSLIFSHVDTATLLDAVSNVCRSWRAACGDDVYGPKVRLELRSILQVLRIRPECVGLWVAAMVGRFAWVVGVDLSRCDVEDGVLECAGNLQRVTSLQLGGDWRSPSKITDTGLEYVAQLTQLTSLNLKRCHTITDTGAGACCPAYAAHQPEPGGLWQDHGHGAGACCPTHAAQQPELA